MKVLEVVHGFPPSAQGGAELYAHAHAIALTRHCGDAVTVLTREQDAARPEYDVRTEDRDGLQIFRINNTFRETKSFVETYRNDAIASIADRIIEQVNPDVAHIHHLTGLSTDLVRSLASRRIPCFFTLHDYWLMCHRGQLLDTDYRVCSGPEHGTAESSASACSRCVGLAGAVGPLAYKGAAAVRAIERRLPETAARPLRQMAQQVASLASRAALADDEMAARVRHMREIVTQVTHFLAPSRFMRDRFVAFGIPQDRITVSNYGFDHSLFERSPQRPRRDGPLRLGFLGSLMISKAPHVLLEAVHRLQGLQGLSPGSVTVELMGSVVPYHGDDSYRHVLEPLLNTEGVGVRGSIPHDQIARALATIDVLVVPSIWEENSPLVIHEAFLAGIPVVASRIGGIPEIVEHERNGLLFRPGDVADLEQALRRLIQEPGLYDALASGTPRVRTIEDDVTGTRALYDASADLRIRLKPDPTSYTAKIRLTTFAKAPVVRKPDPTTRLKPDHTAPQLAAIVLNYRSPDQTLIAVKSLLASSRPVDDILVVDNDDCPELRRMLDGIATSVTYMRSATNLGFSGGMNLGMRQALSRGAEHILLVNSDVVVPPDCVAQLEASLSAAPRAGIVGPVVLDRANPDRISSIGMSYDARTGRMRHRSAGTSIDTLDLPAIRQVDGVAGCLMLITRPVIDAIGLLDEDYFFGFEDLDFCSKARRAGFDTILAGRATVYHEGSASIGATSPRRLYYGARNHLMFADRLDRSSQRVPSWLRSSSIVALNLAHAARSTAGPLPARLSAVIRGTWDFARGRVGPIGT